MDQWQGLDEFVAIATAGSFTGGAKLLGTSTTRISRVIVQLEARLQAQLFDRTTRTVKLTDTGRAILEQCRRLLAWGCANCPNFICCRPCDPRNWSKSFQTLGRQKNRSGRSTPNDVIFCLKCAAQ